MNTFVFSDTHFTKRFSLRQFRALTKLISEADRVIINGDFWEGLSITFDEFLQSKWNQLFPLLKEKKAIYIYGNHDDRIFSDERVYRFCDQAVDEYYLDLPEKKYYFRHGQEFLFPQYFRDRHECHLKRATSLRMRLSNYKNWLIQYIAFEIFGPKILPSIVNHISQKERDKIGKPGYLLVCGHTHRPGYNPKRQFIDIGFFNFGWANYLSIDSKGEFDLVSKRY